MTPDFDHLRNINTFRQLVVYLRDELDWPIEGDDFEELTFEYSAEDLGLDSATAAKIKEIKQLRPLNSKQPWGIFFVNFEPKKLPIVALRRILSTLVLKKRQSANKAHQAAWRLHDLLFISSYGESNHRDITFAHFAEEKESGDLPTLRVLGWDDEDTKLHIGHVEKVLKAKLRWPQDESRLEDWRAQWSSAFTLRPREVITTSKMLAVRLAELARSIRKRANAVLRIETGKGPLRKLYAAFKEALIHDLSEDDFADMYAQTISYGLLTARMSRPMGIIAENLKDMIPVTNPFLHDLLATFLTVGGRKREIDFDELGITEVVALLNDSDTEAIKRDFGDRNPDEDPVIHFYELFLKEYDAKKRVERGVFYTPRPVVSFIVRSVHEILQKEFDLEDGLADTTTWNEMLTRHKTLRPPAGVSLDGPFVQVLDPATGTGTFLVEVIEVIYTTMRRRWKKQGHMELEFPKLWNEYVPKHLLPRLCGFELMMAPYAIAHMKVGLKLYETGYRFGSDERARVYLTNSLEPPSDDKKQREFEEWAPALAHEAQAVNATKRRQRFTVVIGNPPYSNFGQLNKIPFILELLGDYKRDLDEKKINLDDDFIKFVRLSQYLIDESSVGVHGMITNNAYLDGLTHRRMRRRLMETFSVVHITNLHGSSKKKEKAPDGGADENVFDITVGVAIAVLVRQLTKKPTSLAYADCWGTRTTKTKCLDGDGPRMHWLTLRPAAENFFFVPKDFSRNEEYQSGWGIGDVFMVWQNGLKTDRDELFFDYGRDVLEERMRHFFVPKLDAQFRQRYEVAASSSYDIEARRLATKFAASNIRLCLYRPMDIRWLYYDPNLTSRPAEKVMKHMLAGPNLGIITTRQTQDKWDVLATTHLCGHKSCAAYDINSLFPLYLYEDTLDFGQVSGRERTAAPPRRPNLEAKFLKGLSERLQLPQTEDGLPHGITSEDIFNYAYAVFHSPGYRSHYAEFLKIDFPRLPLTGTLALFRSLAKVGGELVALQLLESSKLDKPITIYVGAPQPEVEKISYGHRTVWVDKEQTCGFRGVPEEVWEFHIGGYQVCEKWLKDRKARKLSKADIQHYQKIVVVLHETIRIMAEIDKVIDAHGGWPGAFATNAVAKHGSVV